MAEKQGKDMGTAVTAEERGGIKSSTPAPQPPREPWSFTAHKPGEGYATRLGMMVVVMAYTFFACHHWYFNWVFVRDFFDNMLRGTFLGFLTNWMFNPGAAGAVAGVGAGVVAAAGFFVAYYFIYVKRNSAEFLIKTDGELGKVTWPQITPWFKPETKVWGATYVVLIVVAALTLYVFGIDLILQWIANNLFYSAGG